MCIIKHFIKNIFPVDLHLPCDNFSVDIKCYFTLKPPPLMRGLGSSVCCPQLITEVKQSWAWLILGWVTLLTGALAKSVWSVCLPYAAVLICPYEHIWGLLGHRAGDLPCTLLASETMFAHGLMSHSEGPASLWLLTFFWLMRNIHFKKFPKLLRVLPIMLFGQGCYNKFCLHVLLFKIALLILLK